MMNTFLSGAGGGENNGPSHVVIAEYFASIHSSEITPFIQNDNHMSKLSTPKNELIKLTFVQKKDKTPRGISHSELGI